MASDHESLSLEAARRRREHECDTSRMYNIKEVGDHCRLPGPVIAQLVPRTWTDRGWMYTRDQMEAAVDIAADLRRKNANGAPAAVDPSTNVLICDGCGAIVGAGEASRAGWLNTAAPDTSDTLGRDYCPNCLVPCPACAGATMPTQPCPTCAATGRVAKRF